MCHFLQKRVVTSRIVGGGCNLIRRRKGIENKHRHSRARCVGTLRRHKFPLAGFAVSTRRKRRGNRTTMCRIARSSMEPVWHRVEGGLNTALFRVQLFQYLYCELLGIVSPHSSHSGHSAHTTCTTISSLCRRWRRWCSGRRLRSNAIKDDQIILRCKNSTGRWLLKRRRIYDNSVEIAGISWRTS